SDNGDVVALGEFRGGVPAASVRDQPHHGDLGDAHVLGGSGDRGRHFGVGDLAEPEEVAGECGDLGARFEVAVQVLVVVRVGFEEAFEDRFEFGPRLRVGGERSVGQAGFLGGGEEGGAAGDDQGGSFAVGGVD